MERQKIPARRNGIQRELPGSQHHAGRPELLAPGGTDPRTILSVHPSGFRRLQRGTDQQHGDRPLCTRANRQDETVRQLQQRRGEPAVHLVHETGICENGQMDALRPAGGPAAERLDGSGLYPARKAG